MRLRGVIAFQTLIHTASIEVGACRIPGAEYTDPRRPVARDAAAPNRIDRDRAFKSGLVTVNPAWLTSATTMDTPARNCADKAIDVFSTHVMHRDFVAVNVTGTQRNMAS